MKIIKKTLKYLGILLLIVASVVGVFFYCFFTINNNIYLETPEELQAEFGTFEEGEILKKEKIAPFKIWVISLAGIVFPKQKEKFNSLNSTELYAIAYKSDDLIVHGLLALPEKEGNFPCLIYNRGGNRNSGRLTFHQAFEFMIPYANEGYVVIASNYRGNNGGQGNDEFGGSDIKDVMNLRKVLPEIEQADTSRIGLIGHSRGGMMTYLALQNHNIFKTAVVLAGSADKYSTIAHRPNMETYVFAETMPDYYNRKEEHLFNRSVVRWPEKLDDIPILLVHGSADDRVTYEEAETVAHKLDGLDRDFQFITVEGGGHSLRGTSYKRNVKSWLDKYLRNDLEFEETERRISIP